MLKIGIIGANGFLGLELIRILKAHPKVVISKILQRDSNIEEEFSHLKTLGLDKIQTDNLDDFKYLDCVFLSLPHGSAEEYVKELIDHVKIIDLSADYRIADQDNYFKYYKSNFNTDLQKKFQYGFIEKNYSSIKNTSYIANPGCFALTAQLSILSFEDIIDQISITAITGSSGGGKAPTLKNHHSVRSKDLFSYNINSHRHLSEIYQSFPSLESCLSFIPLSGSFSRGIYLTAHISTNTKINEQILMDRLQSHFNNMPFIRIQNQTKLSNVVGSNYCDISISYHNDHRFVVEACLDNLVKGASGNAVECMNLMYGLDQDMGLNNLIPTFL